MRQYKIENSDLWFKIFREREEEKEYYDVNWWWQKKKIYAKIFFHRADAESALVVIRMKKWKTEEASNEVKVVKVEKQSRSEF